MRVFTYGIKKEKMDVIKHRFGTADYFDVRLNTRIYWHCAWILLLSQLIICLKIF